MSTWTSHAEIGLAIAGLLTDGRVAPGVAGGASLLTGWVLGLMLGVRHALDPDHIAAVSTLVSRQGKSWRAAFLGAWWGLGHSAALLAVGGALVAVRGELPPWLEQIFELGVAAMLLFLGARGVWQAWQAGTVGFTARHTHGALEHDHSGPADHMHLSRWTLARRPFVVGLVHGLAGSGALTALALASMPTVLSGILYMLLFGAGSIAGMALLTGAAGAASRRMVRSELGQARLVLVTGAFSAILGLVWGAPLMLELIRNAA